MNQEQNPYAETREEDLQEEADRFQEFSDSELIEEHKNAPERFARVRLYPVWICSECGERYGRRPCGIATWHQDTCDVCGKHDMVTEPRDYGHLQGGWEHHNQTTNKQNVKQDTQTD